MRRKIKKRLVFGIVLLMAAIVFAVAMTMNISANGPEILDVQDTTLITDRYGGRVIEVDSSGDIVWEKTGLNYPQDAERLANGNTLITDTYNHRVIEVDSDGYIVWDNTDTDLIEHTFVLVYPVDAERLENGHTLITDAFITGTSFGRVIEVGSSGDIVWQMNGLILPQDAERLENGNTLITDTFNRRVIEVDYFSKEVVWKKTGLGLPYDAERLENDNTLITDTGYGCVIEVDSDGYIVWDSSTDPDPPIYPLIPYDAERLANGNTLITDTFNRRVIEVDISGVIVWDSTDLENPIYLFSPSDAERLVPLSSFKTFIIEKAKIDFKKKPDDDKIHVKGRFELGLDSDDVDISEDVIVTIGLFTETIKMEAKGKGDKWEYKRPKGENGIKHMKIDWKKKKKKKKNHHAEFDIRVDKLEDMIWTNPVTINIQIGDDIGSETITMKVHKHHWDYHKKKHQHN